MVRVAQARPAMLAVSATKNTIVGVGRLRPSDIPSAVAHTASNTALTSSTIHGTSAHRLQADDRADEQDQQRDPGDAEPVPTHTAYAVPVGRDCMAHARPTMLRPIERRKTTVGTARRKPCEAASAVAHTASSMPEPIRMNHAMANPSESVLSWCGYCSLVREPCRRAPRRC